MNALTLGIEEVKGVGAKRAAVLNEVGIHTLGDLFYYLPRRYLDRSRTLPMARAPIGQEVTLIGHVRQMRFVPGRKPRFVLVVEDETDDIACTFFQGGRYLQRNFKEGDELAISGKVDLFQGRRQMVHPEYEFIRTNEDELLHTGGIVPLYTSSADMKERGLRNRGFRRMMHGALEAFADQIEDGLPLAIRQRQGLGELGDSLRKVHFPTSMDEVAVARRRLAFGELFDLQLRLARLRKKRLEQAEGIAFSESQKLVPQLLASLPFELTAAQRRVGAEIYADMQSPQIMNRLVQGDVGSGKTLVGLGAILMAVENGYQAALMAPTEILAEQHYINIKTLVEPLGLTAVFLKGKQRKALRRELLTAIESGVAHIVVGTHALIQEEVHFARLGLAVVDEQHRFGVVQRGALYKKGEKPDLLVMTATPIPRTLALTLYGELEVSVIDELPPGRQPIRTALRAPDRRDAIFEFAGDQARQGRQVYVVYPLIEESEKMDLKSAVEAYEELCHGHLAEFEVALLHGRLAAEEKAEVMDAFKKNRIQVLVSTTVIEVGVDVPNATVMIIEHAERFGLAQLHQLRGRVGRGGEQSFCILVSYASAGAELSDSRERLEMMERTQDGFEIAEKDLQIRGPGEFFGTRQAGMPEFKVADLIEDEDLLQSAREEATRMVAAEA
ncbi:MAG: ATP-dependent DNA helicase RecG [Gemmatimonadetes bacterium]|jgi:ATP-dependent DNA helicase RecG|nr:ATP-dependent DNA helicase RecG [Gemmatimonadota bacterium]MBT5326071.1 ATP-dependent DNA helicase RecG [Gemmatimonadota bacterium]MBT5449318.1 ATP-dependent DNA helicase RecG [Gemmatimonadota bacterium]MBT5804227.1 ATP-dependent DNA helicase RecG [Gemmatimonadota bacterium]MBT6620384.1 ATP-dependent DNA helicase RecG [Gemmatimonadota bacterium]